MQASCAETCHAGACAAAPRPPDAECVDRGSPGWCQRKRGKCKKSTVQAKCAHTCGCETPAPAPAPAECEDTGSARFCSKRQDECDQVQRGATKEHSNLIQFDPIGYCVLQYVSMTITWLRT